MRSLLGDIGLLSDDNRAVAVFKQFGRVYRGENGNGKRLLRYKVDGEWQSDCRSCDFALGIPDCEIIYLTDVTQSEAAG